MTRHFFKTAFVAAALAFAGAPLLDAHAQDNTKINALADDVTKATRLKLLQARLANFGDIDDTLSLKILDALLADGTDFARFLVDDRYADRVLSASDELKQYLHAYLTGRMTTKQYQQINDLLATLYPNLFDMLPGLAS